MPAPCMPRRPARSGSCRRGMVHFSGRSRPAGVGKVVAMELTGFRLAPQAYEEDLVPVLFAGLATRLVELVGPRPGERVLGVACGTGAVPRLLAERVLPGGEVTGLDLSEPMVAFAASCVPAATFVAGDAAALPFAD